MNQLYIHICALFFRFPSHLDHLALSVTVIKNLRANSEDIRYLGSILGSKDSLEEGRVAHCSILAWRIPWTEESGRLQSNGSQRVGHNWNNLACINIVTGLHIYIYIYRERERERERELGISSVQFSHSVMSDSLQPHGLQYIRLPCPSLTLGAYSNSCPLSQ